MSLLRRVTQAVAVISLAALLGGCFTGKRPTLTDDPFAPGTPTADAQLGSILTLLDQAPRGPVTVHYEILRKADPKTTEATVVVRGGDIAVQVGQVRYISVGTNRQTCNPACSPTWQAQPISDTGVTPLFYGEQISRKIRRYAVAMIGPAVASTAEVGGTPAQCRALPLAGGTAKYCVFDSGLVASADDGDIRITATAVTPAADDAAFSAAGR